MQLHLFTSTPFFKGSYLAGDAGGKSSSGLIPALPFLGKGKEDCSSVISVVSQQPCGNGQEKEAEGGP